MMMDTAADDDVLRANNGVNGGRAGAGRGEVEESFAESGTPTETTDHNF